jgi:biotin synthase
MYEECEINLCASHGFLTEEEFIRLKEAEVTMYHENDTIMLTKLGFNIQK